MASPEGERIERVIERLKSSKRILVLTGAGISKDSGIPTFRGEDGLWKRYRAEDLANPFAFQENPELVWEWYRWRQGIIKKAKPNSGHLAIAEMEKSLPDFLLVTQNVDNLHKEAGNEKIIELHGNIFRSKCARCGKMSTEEIKENLPKCECGGLLRPDVVWFGESLREKDLKNSFEFAHSCDFCFVIGTSAVVYPAAQLPYIAKNSRAFLVEINLSPTPVTELADISFQKSASKILPHILSLYKEPQINADFHRLDKRIL